MRNRRGFNSLTESFQITLKLDFLLIKYMFLCLTLGIIEVLCIRTVAVGDKKIFFFGGEEGGEDELNLLEYF